jgi:quercetin dioxygenase-like cupin family protein
MHVAPAEFRSVRSAGLTVRFTILGDMAFVLVELPASGSKGTRLEELCERPHWAFVLDGSVELETGDGVQAVAGGTAFHIPVGLTHRIRSTGPARITGFERIDAGSDVSDEGLRRQGYQVLPGRSEVGPQAIVPTLDPRVAPPEPVEVATTGVQMGDLLFSQTRFGPRSGYASPFCDLEHWGLVTAGSIAIEWEDDVEVLTSGDIFHCPAGPPGHRFQAADPAATIDFTPLASFDRGTRVVEWRHALAASVRASRSRRASRKIEVAPLR